MGLMFFFCLQVLPTSLLTNFAVLCHFGFSEMAMAQEEP